MDLFAKQVLRITDDKIYGLEGVSKKGQWRISELLEVVLEKGIIENGVIVKTEKFQEILTNSVAFFMKKRIKKILILENGYIDRKIISLPSCSNRELKNIIKYKIEIDDKYDFEKYYIDYKIIKKQYKKPKKSDILVTFTPKEIPNSYYEHFYELGYRFNKLDIETNCLSKLIKKELFKKGINYIENNLFLSIHRNFIVGNIFENKMLAYSKVVNTVADYNDWQNYIKEIASHLDHLIKYYISRKSKNSIEKIYIYGDIPNVENLIPELELWMQSKISKVNLTPFMINNQNFEKDFIAIGGLINY